MRRRAGLELRLGFELTPARPLLDEDPRRYVLEGTDRRADGGAVRGPCRAPARRSPSTSRRSGLRPVIAHPERAEAVLDDPAIADELAERGWTLQVNATLVARPARARARASSPGARRATASPTIVGVRRPSRDAAARASTMPTGSSRATRRRGATALFDGRRSASASGRDGLHLAQGREAPERLELDLADPLAGEPKPAADLLERLRLGVVEAVAEHQHLPLALVQRGERRRAPASGARPRPPPRAAGRRRRRSRRTRRPPVRRPAGRGRRRRARRPAPRSPAGAAGRLLGDLLERRLTSELRPEGAARRGSSSACARRCGRASGSSGPCRRAPARPPGGSTRSRTSRTCSRGASRTSRPRG